MNILNVYFFLNHTVYCLLIILSSNYVKKNNYFHLVCKNRLLKYVNFKRFKITNYF